MAKKSKQKSTQKAAPVDRKDRKCEKCHEGYYTETSIYDDWDGVLHCSKCGHQVKRRG